MRDIKKWSLLNASSAHTGQAMVERDMMGQHAMTEQSRTGYVRKDMEGHDRTRQDIAGPGRTWHDITGHGDGTEYSGTTWQSMTEQDRTTRCDRTT